MRDKGLERFAFAVCVAFTFVLIALSLPGCSYCWGLAFGNPEQPADNAIPGSATDRSQRPADTGSSVVRTGNLGDQHINIQLTRIMFEFDSAVIRPQFQARLQDYAMQLRANPAVTLSIEGHCCEIGSFDYNVALGERRARAVRQYLIDLGINPARLSFVSFGEENPIDPGHTESSRSKNRRAEFVIRE